MVARATRPACCPTRHSPAPRRSTRPSRFSRSGRRRAPTAVFYVACEAAFARPSADGDSCGSTDPRRRSRRPTRTPTPMRWTRRLRWRSSCRRRPTRPTARSTPRTSCCRSPTAERARPGASRAESTRSAPRCRRSSTCPGLDPLAAAVEGGLRRDRRRRGRGGRSARADRRTRRKTKAAFCAPRATTPTWRPTSRRALSGWWGWNRPRSRGAAVRGRSAEARCRPRDREGRQQDRRYLAVTGVGGVGPRVPKENANHDDRLCAPPRTRSRGDRGLGGVLLRPQPRRRGGRRHRQGGRRRQAQERRRFNAAATDARIPARRRRRSRASPTTTTRWSRSRNSARSTRRWPRASTRRNSTRRCLRGSTSTARNGVRSWSPRRRPTPTSPVSRT